MATQERRKTKAPHPLLRIGSTSNDVYAQVKSQPGVTVMEIADVLHLPYNTAKEHVRKLKNEGLVVSSGTKPSPHSSNQQECLRVVRENESSRPRDMLTVNVTVYVNDFGEYSAVAKIEGESPLSHEGNPQPYHTQQVKFRVPRPDEPAKTRQLFHRETATPLTIEGEIVSSGPKASPQKALALSHEVRGIRPKEGR